MAYYCSLDASGQRMDRKLRPELQLGSVEFNVGKNYTVRPMQVGAVLREIEAAHQQHLASSFSNMNSQNNSFK
eukprot:gene27960-34749_t